MVARSRKAELADGEFDTYHRHCAEMLRYFGDRERIPYRNCDWVCRACTLVPDAVSDWSTVLALADRLVKMCPEEAVYLVTRGGVLYRSGRWKEALGPLTEGHRLLKDNPNPYRRLDDARSCSFLAMAHHRMGHRDEARKWFDRMVEQTEAAMEADRSGKVNIYWNNQADMKLLRPEAAHLLVISESASPAKQSTERPARQNPLLPNIVFGEWFPLLPPAGQFLGWDALKDQVRYSKRTLDTPDKEWSPLLTSPDQLVGWEGLNDRVRYSNRTIETRVRVGIAYPLIAKDVSIRARAKKVSGERIWLVLRSSANGRYAAVFNGVGGPFCIVRFSRDNSHVRLAEVVAPETCDNFFDFRFSAVGDALTVFVNDKPLLRTHDSSLTDGTLEIGGDGDGSFTDVAIFIPTEESLLADNRELRGPFADPLVLDEACTRLLEKEPDNFALYKQCAALRARYAKNGRKRPKTWPRPSSSIRMT